MRGKVRKQVESKEQRSAGLIRQPTFDSKRKAFFNRHVERRADYRVAGIAKLLVCLFGVRRACAWQTGARSPAVPDPECFHADERLGRL